jgi:hypothetical protein
MHSRGSSEASVSIVPGKYRTGDKQAKSPECRSIKVDLSGAASVLAICKPRLLLETVTFKEEESRHDRRLARQLLTKCPARLDALADAVAAAVAQHTQQASGDCATGRFRSSLGAQGKHGHGQG